MCSTPKTKKFEEEMICLDDWLQFTIERSNDRNLRLGPGRNTIIWLFQGDTQN